MLKFLKGKLGFILAACLGLSSCNPQESIDEFCAGTTIEDYRPDFVIWCPSQGDDYFVPLRYGCPPSGEGVSLPIAWKGIPQGTTHLRIVLLDATCVLHCNSHCKRANWQIEIPLEEIGKSSSISDGVLAEGANQDPVVISWTLPNEGGMKTYSPLCPPMEKVHAYILRGIAYRYEAERSIILGRCQSAPLLFSTAGKKGPNS